MLLITYTWFLAVAFYPRLFCLCVKGPIAYFTQPVQDQNIAPLPHLTFLYKRYEHGIGGIVVLHLSWHSR